MVIVNIPGTCHSKIYYNGGHVIFIVSALELCCLKDNPSTQINDVTTVTNNGLSEELIRCLQDSEFAKTHKSLTTLSTC